jgi:hypothetical protein
MGIIIFQLLILAWNIFILFLDYPEDLVWAGTRANCERLMTLELRDAQRAAMGVLLPRNAPYDYGSGAYGETHHDNLVPHG